MEKLSHYEHELKKRWAYPYQWGQVQNNQYDALTQFVYEIGTFEDVIKEVEKRYAHAPNAMALRDYAFNRWYNFWSARAIEQVFCSLEGVTPASNPRDRLVDFSIYGVRFDHKTSVFPRNFGHDLCYAINHPARLIRWLYTQQSRQKRQHYANRLFIVLYATGGQHWKLKAELTWLKTIIQGYVTDFDAQRLWRFTFSPGTETLSDVIWAIRCQ
ncbi:MAG: hypothetical protein JXA21_07630 [Anaerolineae bacterium]|nr:hypothetical protein [Anaerolineae bacterium]